MYDQLLHGTHQLQLAWILPLLTGDFIDLVEVMR